MSIDLRQAPRTSDGKLIQLPNLFPGGVITNFTGVGDDVTNGTRFGGAEFKIQSSSIEQATLEFRFMEWLYLAGGGFFSSGGIVGDWLSYEVQAPATVGTSNPGAGAYNKVEIIPSSGLHIYVPAPAVDGDWDLNLTEKYNANVNFTKVVPVPASSDGTGFFDWSDSEEVTLNALQKGGFNIYDFDLTIGKFVQKMTLLGGNLPLTIPAIKPKKLLPHWKHKVTVNNSTTKSLDVGWYLYGARVDIT